eukprot:284819406_5
MKTSKQNSPASTATTKARGLSGSFRSFRCQSCVTSFNSLHPGDENGHPRQNEQRHTFSGACSQESHAFKRRRETEGAGGICHGCVNLIQATSVSATDLIPSFPGSVELNLPQLSPRAFVVAVDAGEFCLL